METVLEKAGGRQRPGHTGPWSHYRVNVVCLSNKESFFIVTITSI